MQEYPPLFYKALEKALVKAEKLGHSVTGALEDAIEYRRKNRNGYMFWLELDADRGFDSVDVFVGLWEVKEKSPKAIKGKRNKNSKTKKRSSKK